MQRGAAVMTETFTRREFLAGMAAAATTAHLGASTSLLSSSSATAMAEFDYEQVRLTGGPLAVQYDAIRRSYLALDNDRLLKVYRERAGMPAPAGAMGGWYGRDGFVPGHALGQYISGLARMGRTIGDNACDNKVELLVEGFAATLGAQNQVFAAPNAEKVWPCYVVDKHLAGLIDASQLTGMTAARELLPKVWRGALPHLPATGRDRIGKKDPPYDETYVLPENLFAAHVLTGERMFLERAIAYLLDEPYFKPLARGEDVLPGRHAYSHVIALSSAAKARLALGEDSYLDTLRNAYKLLATTQQYATGGWGPNETFVAPHQGKLYESLHTTVDHFETPCGSYAAIKLARYLLCATGEACYGDGLERVLYNGLLAVKPPDANGDYPYYSSYGPRARKAYYQSKWPCCSGTLIQGVADYVRNIYFRTTQGVAVNLFAPSELRWNHNGVALTLTQQTEYPLDNNVLMRVGCAQPARFVLSVRIPSWLTRPPKLLVNGRAVPAQWQRGFAVLDRLWSDGDTVTLQLEQSFRTEAIDDLHPETVAVLRGPLVYVEVNPTSDGSALDALEKRISDAHDHGRYVSQDGENRRVHVPFYTIGEQSYTMYFTNSAGKSTG
jgi:uncharacterized protein